MRRKYICALVTYQKSGSWKNVLQSHHLKIYPMTFADFNYFTAYLALDATAVITSQKLFKETGQTHKKRLHSVTCIRSIGKPDYCPTTRKRCFCKPYFIWIISTKATLPVGGQSSVVPLNHFYICEPICLLPTSLIKSSLLSWPFNKDRVLQFNFSFWGDCFYNNGES